MSKSGGLGFSSDTYLMPPVMLSDYQTKNHAANRWSRYQRYLEFYRGAQWDQVRRPGERRLTINYARTFIQKHASYLMGKPVQFELIPNNDDQAGQELAQRCEERLREMWDDNGLALIDYDAAVDCAILGDGAFKVTLQGYDQGDPLHVADSSKMVGGKVVVRSVDVNGLDAGWSSDLRSLLWVCEQTPMTAEQARAAYPGLLEAAGLDEQTLSDRAEVPVVERWDRERYSVTVNGVAIIDEANPYGFVPYLVFPNRSVPRSPWGESDLEDVMGLASELNIRASVLSQLLQLSGNPPLILENVEDANGLRVGPGAVWTLPEGSKAYMLELIKEGGVSLHVQYIELIYKMLHDLSELPAEGFGRGETGSAARSSVAMEMLLHSVVQRVNRKRRIWDEVLDRRNRMMLALASLPVHRSRIVWPDILPKDRAALVTQAVGLVASSIWSLETARRELGQEQPEKENELILAERQKLGVGQDSSSGGKQQARGAGSGGLYDQPPVKLSGALVSGLSNSAG